MGQQKTGSVLRAPSGWVAAGILAAIAILAHWSAIWTPFLRDDGYVLAHVSSPQWIERLTAFNVDQPGQLGPWWEGIELQRRFIRIIPSLVMAGEVRLFGPNPIWLHLITLILHIANTMLLYSLLRRVGLPEWGPMSGAAIFASHPAATEPVAWWCCEPIVFAGMFGLGAALALVESRARDSKPLLALACLLCILCVTSYEAAALVPLVLILLDEQLARRTARGSIRSRIIAGLGLASAWPILGALTLWNRTGLTRPDTSFRPSLAEAWCIGRVDLANYVLKSVGMVDPHQPSDYWLDNNLGEGLTLLLVAAIVVPVFAWALRRGPARLGLTVFVALLLPPFLIRTLVGALNNPTLRQLYLPSIGLGILVGLAVTSSTWRLAAPVALGLAALAIPFNATLDATRFGGPEIQQAQAQVRAALSSSDPATPVIILGSFNDGPAACSYSIWFDWPRRKQWMLVPPAIDGQPPQIEREGPRAFVATAPQGFAVPLEFREHRPVTCDPGHYTGMGTRADVNPPSLVRDGWEDVEGARVEVVERNANVLTKLRFTLPKPLESWAFLSVEGCRVAALLHPE